MNEDSRLLQGMRVAVMRDAEGIARWTPTLEAAGAVVIPFPVMKISVTPLTDEIHKYLQAKYDWLIFTSAHGVEAYAQLATEAGIAGTPLQTNPQIVAIGEHTAAVAKELLHEASFIPSQQNKDTIATELPLSGNENILYVSSQIASPKLPSALRARQAYVTELVAYETRIIPGRDPHFNEALTSKAIDALVFASPSEISGFLVRITPEARKRASVLTAIGIGHTTAEALKSVGFTNVHTSETPSISGIVAVLSAIAIL